MVVDAIHDDFDSAVEDDEYEDEDKGEDNGELQSGFKAMDITGSHSEEETLNPGGEASLADATLARTQDFDSGKSSPKKKKNKKKKKKKQKRKGQFQGNEGDAAPNRRRQPVSVEQFVVHTCRRIGETKYPLFREAVDRIGMDAVKALLDQVDAVENCGGQMTADGLRRRSAGGVLWSLLRDHVGPELYKEIMKDGNRKHIEQQKAKLKERENERENERGNERGHGKRQHEERDDERQSVKRRRTSMDVDDRPARSVSRERLLRRTSLRDEVDNVRAPAALQNAWIQGLKRHGALNPKPLEEKASNPNPKGIPRPVSERVRMTVSYGDLVEGESATGAEEGVFSQELDEMKEEEYVTGFGAAAEIATSIIGWRGIVSILEKLCERRDRSCS